MAATAAAIIQTYAGTAFTFTASSPLAPSASRTIPSATRAAESASRAVATIDTIVFAAVHATITSPVGARVAARSIAVTIDAGLDGSGPARQGSVIRTLNRRGRPVITGSISVMAGR